MKLQALKPTEVFRYFEEISAIPRGSGNEKEISSYLVNFARQRNLTVIQDGEYNVIIKKNGSRGCENSKTVILQGHMDMVCEKSSGSAHDFINDGIDLKVDGDFVTANNTTLGADNGIAVAYALAILDSKDMVHPPLEVLITTNEETGMNGAMAVDPKNLDGRILINMDSEEDDCFLVGCAGGATVTLELPIQTDECPANFVAYEIKISGLMGGHSGTEINKQRANANKLMGRTLSRLYNSSKALTADIKGGTKDNVIANECTATIVSPQGNDIIGEVLNLQQEFQAEFAAAENELKITAIKVAVPTKVMCEAATKKVFEMLILLPNGVLTMSTIPNLVETSANIGIVRTEADAVKFTVSVRSAVLSRKQAVVNKLQIIAEVMGATATIGGEYPAWEYKKESDLREIFKLEYTKLFKTYAKVETLHAGLECGIFYEKLSDCDIISIGPNMQDIHSPKERVQISSVLKIWNLLTNVLKQLA